MIPPANQLVEWPALPVVKCDSPHLQKLANDAMHAYIGGLLVKPDRAQLVKTSIELVPAGTPSLELPVVVRYNFSLFSDVASGTQQDDVLVKCSCYEPEFGFINDTTIILPLEVHSWDAVRMQWCQVLTYYHRQAPQAQWPFHPEDLSLPPNTDPLA